jgi:hypothetical protein
MGKIVLGAALALAGLSFATPAAAAPQAGANDAACAYDSLSAGERESLRALTFERMMRGADEEATAPSRSRIDLAIASAQAGCGQRHGWSAPLAGLSHEFAALSLARDAFRRMLAEQGLSSEPLDAYHRDHRGEFGRELTAPQQAAFTAELAARQWAAGDPSDSALDVAVGYLRILNDLEHCRGVFAVALASSQARPVQTAAR